jgi:hypothetical protein
LNTITQNAHPRLDGWICELLGISLVDEAWHGGKQWTLHLEYAPDLLKLDLDLVYLAKHF